MAETVASTRRGGMNSPPFAPALYASRIWSGLPASQVPIGTAPIEEVAGGAVVLWVDPTADSVADAHDAADGGPAAACVAAGGCIGAAEALTGPLARGDLSTLEANLEALDATFPEAAAAYRAVSLLGLRLVIERGAVDDATILAMKALLEGGAGAEVEGAP